MPLTINLVFAGRIFIQANEMLFEIKLIILMSGEFHFKHLLNLKIATIYADGAKN